MQAYKYFKQPQIKNTQFLCTPILSFKGLFLNFLKMIGLEEVYKVIAATVPLYVALLLGYGSVRWWHIFTHEQCNAINRFVCFFTLPLFTFEFTAHIDPFNMNYRFIGADAISKVIIVVVLTFWARFSSKGSCSWSITSFSLSTLTNSLVVGVPLVRAMYGQEFVNLVVQGSVVQAIVWLTALLFVLECRSSAKTDCTVNATEFKDLEGNLKLDVDQPVVTKLSLVSLMKVVSLKLAMNPNSYSCVIGIVWATISNRFKWPMPDMIEGSVLIMSRAGTGTAMFSVGLFMAKQEKLIACGTNLTVLAIVLKFFAGPATMAISCIAVGLHGDTLRVAIIQSALPQSITSFIYAKEYGLHADVLSTAVQGGLGSCYDIMYAAYPAYLCKRCFKWLETMTSKLQINNLTYLLPRPILRFNHKITLKFMPTFTVYEVVFGMIVTLPIMVGFYAVLEFLH